MIQVMVSVNGKNTVATIRIRNASPAGTVVPGMEQP